MQEKPLFLTAALLCVILCACSQPANAPVSETESAVITAAAAQIPTFAKDTMLLLPYAADGSIADEDSMAACLADAPLVDATGCELYGLFPGNQTLAVRISRYTPFGADGKPTIGVILYETNTPQPIRLKCNESDILSNTWIELSQADGTVISFSPGISLKDGTLVLPDTVDDATDYGDPDYTEVRELLPNTTLDLYGAPLLTQHKNDYGTFSSVLYYRGNEYLVFEESNRVMPAYVLPDKNNTFYVLVQQCKDSDYKRTYLIHWNGTAFKSLGMTEGGMNGLSDFTEAGIELHSRLNVLGTYETVIPARILNGNLEETGTFYDFQNQPNAAMAEFIQNTPEAWDYLQTHYTRDGERILILKTDLYAVIDGEDTLLTAGSVIYPTGCDTTEQRFYFRCAGGSGYLQYELADRYTVNGISEDECFLELPYAD